MAIVFSLILSLFGILFYVYKKGCFFIQFLYVWIVFCPFLYALVFNLEASDFWTFGTWCNRCLLAICLVAIFIKARDLREIKISFIIYIFFCLYYIYLSLFRGVGIIEGIQYSYGCFLCIICLPLILTRKTKKRTLLLFINTILWIELTVGMVQYFIPSLNYSSYIAVIPNDVQPLSGTLYGNNTYIEFLLVLWYCITYQYLKKNHFSFLNLLQTIFFLFLLIQSGVRVAIVAALPLFTYLFYKFYLYKEGKIVKSKLLTAILFLSIALILLIGYFSASRVTYTTDATSGIERNMVIASVFLDNSFLLEHTTFSLSYDVLRHFSENYLFGPGLLFIGNGYDGYINMDANNVTDATLAIYICETGIVGILFLIFFIYYILQTYSNGDTSIKWLIITLIVLTVTDSGIFSLYNLLVLFTMIYLNRHRKQELLYNAHIKKRPENNLSDNNYRLNT